MSRSSHPDCRAILNRSTEAWRDYLLARYPSPLQVLAETYSRPVADLVAELGCTPLEALKVQVAAAGELAPYLHGKMPVEVAISGSLPMVQLVDPTAALAAWGSAMAGGGLLDLSAVEIVGNQGLGDDAAEAVGKYKSENPEKAEGFRAFPGGGPLIWDQSEGDR